MSVHISPQLNTLPPVNLDAVVGILSQMQAAPGHMAALQIGLEFLATAVQAQRGVVLLQPGTEDESFPILAYHSQLARKFRTVNPNTLFDNWVLSWSKIEMPEWSAISLSAYGELAGAIYLDAGEDVLSEAQASPLGLICSQLAITLASIRDSIKAHHLGVDRETFLQVLTTVGEIDQRLSANISIGQVLDELQEAYRFLVNAEVCVIWEVRPEKLVLVYPDDIALTISDAATGNILAAWVVQTGQSVLVPDVSSDERCNPRIYKSLGIEAHQVVAVPLIENGQPCWVVEIINKQWGRFDEFDVRLIELLAMNATSTIENIRRHMSQQQRADETEELYSVASHGLRSPLMSILASIEWLLESAQLTEDDKMRLQEIRLQTFSLSRFATTILDLSRIELDGLRLHLSPVALMPLVRQVVNAFRFRIPNHQLEIQTVGPVPPIHADETQLAVVLDHLIENAIKYSPEGTTIRLEVGATDDDMVQVAVCDRGEGIPPEDLERLFDRFYRGRQRRHARHSLGLGLYIVKKIIDAHYGKIWVETEKDVGSKFIFTVPQEYMGL